MVKPLHVDVWISHKCILILRNKCFIIVFTSHAASSVLILEPGLQDLCP